MATISFQVTESGQANANKTFNLPDADLDRVIAALQGVANASVNGTATRAQVLNYWVTSVVADLKTKVQAAEAAAAIAAVPTPAAIAVT